jgi:hypothetical protein
MGKIAAFDPGLNASAALLDGGKFLDMVDIRRIPDGQNEQLDADHICDLLESWRPDEVVIENVQPMPSIPDKKTGKRRSMGSASAFRFGMQCGVIRGVVRVYGYNPIMVHPQSWTGFFGLKGGDKKPHVALIKDRYPSSVPFITLVKHHGRADAGLMAAWRSETRGLL